jgi:hypothetical protein
MSASTSEKLTPVERLQASRAQMRAVLREAKHPTDSALNTLLKPWASEHPLTLMAAAALLGAVLMTAKPWRWKTLAIPFMTWASLALTSWLRGRAHKA